MGSKCIKCGGEYGPPKYQSCFRGFWGTKEIEWLEYKCKICGYIHKTKCNG